MNISFIIPAYNEAACIDAALHAVSGYAASLGIGWEAVVVDDGSTDQTAAIAARRAEADAHIRVLRQPNRGKGAAVRAGMQAATGEWRIFLDADLSTAPEMFERFRPFLAEVDILIASRAVAGAELAPRQPWPREISGRVFNLLVRAIVGLPFADTQCGFKAFHARTMDLFAAQEFPGWAFDVELLARAKRRGYRVREVPVVWRNDPSSTVRPAAALRAVADLFRIARRAQNW